MTARIETTRPAPWIFVMRNAGSERDRADVHVAIVDVPAFFAGVSQSAAGAGAHAAMIPVDLTIVKPWRRRRKAASVGDGLARLIKHSYSIFYFLCQHEPSGPEGDAVPARVRGAGSPAGPCSHRTAALPA